MTDGRGDGKRGAELGGLVSPGELPAVAAQATAEALARLRGSESLEAAYDAWTLLREQARTLRRRADAERGRLDAQGSFLVGAVRAAGLEPASSGGLQAHSLTPQEPLAELTREANERLSLARALLETQLSTESAALVQAQAQAQAEVAARVERFLTRVRPRLELWHRPVGQERAVLHLVRLSPDESVLLCRLLTGKLPSRHGFLFDEATDDVSLGPPLFYPEEGVEDAEIRGGPERLAALLAGGHDVLPVRGCIPVRIGDALYRLLQRGPVMEVELAEGHSFRGVLSRDEAERFAGVLIRRRLEGKVELELRTGS